MDAVTAIVGRVAGTAPAVDASARSISAPTDGGAGAIAALTAALEDDGIAVEDLGLRQPTLDDVFLTLTGSSVTDAEHAEEIAA
jgi:ABC-2 type transport system ATP-binding protein